MDANTKSSITSITFQSGNRQLLTGKKYSSELACHGACEGACTSLLVNHQTVSRCVKQYGSICGGPATRPPIPWCDWDRWSDPLRKVDHRVDTLEQMMLGDVQDHSFVDTLEKTISCWMCCCRY